MFEAHRAQELRVELVRLNDHLAAIGLEESQQYKAGGGFGSADAEQISVVAMRLIVNSLAQAVLSFGGILLELLTDSATAKDLGLEE